MCKNALRTELKSLDTFFLSIASSFRTCSATFTDFMEPENTVEEPKELYPPVVMPLLGPFYTLLA